MYSRPFKRATSRHEEENEFASLWVERTILRTAYQAASSFRSHCVVHPDPDPAFHVNPETDPVPDFDTDPGF
jgi:hypothetical protein